MTKKSKTQKLEEQTKELAIISQNAQELQENYIDELEVNPKYSLVVDPTNKYNMTDMQKKFVEYYVNFKNVNTAAELCGIDQDTAKQYFISYASQQEIRRINLALYHRQFANRLLTLDEIGGYLSCLLTGVNVPLADQPKTIGDRLAIVKTLIDLNKLKLEGLRNPNVILAQDIDVQIKNLSLATIKQLIAQEAQPVEKIYNANLTPEESAYLSTLPTNELLGLIEQTNNKEDKNDN